MHWLTVVVNTATIQALFLNLNPRGIMSQLRSISQLCKQTHSLMPAYWSVIGNAVPATITFSNDRQYETPRVRGDRA